MLKEVFEPIVARRSLVQRLSSGGRGAERSLFGRGNEAGEKERRSVANCVSEAFLFLFLFFSFSSGPTAVCVEVLLFFLEVD